jgi:hypothetical protein
MRAPSLVAVFAVLGLIVAASVARAQPTVPQPTVPQPTVPQPTVPQPPTTTPPAPTPVQVGVVVIGETALQPQLAAQIANWLHGHELDIVTDPIPGDAVNAMVDCFVIEDIACARKIVDDRAKVGSLVFVRIDTNPGPGNTRDVTLNGYWFDKGQVTVFDERRSCERCSDDRARELADELAAALAAAGRHQSGHYHVGSTPTGAHVVIDGKPAGVTPLDGELPLGEHRVEVSLGKRVADRTIAVQRGELASIDVTLPPAPRGAGHPHVLPGLVVAAGAVATAGGIVLVAIDQEPDAHRVPQPRTLRSTRTGGIVLGVAGVAALASGVYLWLHASQTGAPTVAIDHGGASIGWTGRF